MGQTSLSKPFLLLGSVFLLLIWSAFDYGGRYLHVQVFAQVLSAGILLLFGLQLYASRRVSVLSEYPLLRPSLLWLLALGLSWIFSVNRLASLEEILRVLMYLVLALSVYGWLRLQADPAQSLSRLATGVIAVGCLVALAGWWMRQSGQALSSTFYRTNDLAGYLLLLVPLSLHLFLQARQASWRLYYGLAFSILGSSLALTQSRTSWLAGALALALVLYFQRENLRQPVYRWSALAVLGLLAVGFWLSAETLWPRLQSVLSGQILQENSALWRKELLVGAWDIFLAHPWTGTGPNTYATALPAYQQSPGYYSINPHNYYLQALAETGLVGFVAFLLWLVSLYRAVGRFANPLSAGLLASLSASLFHIAFDIDWSVTAIPILFAVLLGMALVPVNLADPVSEAEDLPDSPLETGPRAVVSGLLGFVALILISLPLLNFLSARAHAQAVGLMNQQDLEAAQSALTQAIGLAPWPSARHHHTQGLLLQRRNQIPEALHYASRSIELDPHNSRYYGLASELLLRLERPTEALAMLLRRLELNPYRHPDLYAELADFYLLHQKQPQEALKWYQKGREAFQLELISRYERYTPSHRYELFNLYQKLAVVLDQLNRQPEAEQIRTQSQEMMQGAPKDLFVQAGYPNPVAAIQAYWQAVPAHQRDPEHRFDSVRPESELPPPPPWPVDASQIRYLQVQRELTSAGLRYALPRVEDPAQWIFLEDQLVGDDQGWKILTRRIVTP